MCRAYKLGKQRWSYNKIQVTLQQEGGDQELSIVEASQHRTSNLNNMEQVGVLKRAMAVPLRFCCMSSIVMHTCSDTFKGPYVGCVICQSVTAMPMTALSCAIM